MDKMSQEPQQGHKYENYRDIRSLTVDECKDLLGGYREPAFRAKQLFSWLHDRQAADYDEMSSLPLSLRKRLKEDWPYSSLTIKEVRVSEIDGTRKYLFSLADGNLIESVLMRYSYGCTVCISTQVGCRMGCRFCASTLDGLVRNLEPGEMLAQVYRIGQDIGERVSHVVLMGSGEPMDNYDNVMRFVELVNHSDGMNLSQRNITLSTCGIVPGIRRLADTGTQMTLALSLHAPNDEIRRTLMPVAKSYPIEEVVEACRYFYEKTGRRVSFEYSLVAGENDREEEAKELCRLLKGFPCHVNLIPVNPIKERSFHPAERKDVIRFQKILEKSGIHATIRREMGRDIDGACGQLRQNYLGNTSGTEA